MKTKDTQKHKHGGRDNNGTFMTVVRIGIIALAVLLQLGIMMVLSGLLEELSAPIYVVLDICATIAVFSLINKHDSSAYRIAWIVIVIAAPIFGLFLYLAWGRVDFNRKERGGIEQAFTRGFASLPDGAQEATALQAAHPQAIPYAKGLMRAGYPLYTDTACRYFPIGEEYFDSLAADLERAEHFILMEYFIIARGQLWDRIHEILKRKVAQGVEVRLLYDDVGCFFKIPNSFDRDLRAEGIKAAIFSPAHRFISSFYMNYRNHQKIVVVDGQVGYAGGVNLADEYINVDSHLGHWKDTGVRLEGGAVRSLTTIFYQMWDVATHNAENDHSAYLNASPAAEGAGFVQPYADGPANNPSNPALDLICRCVSGARDYVWLTSPYLVIDQEISEVFCRAARGGVDVRIITPAVPDHWYVGLVNRYNYRHLLENGVRIYEYTPGFIHGKLMVADDECATVGSVNLDFRSLFLHYENGVFFCGSPIVDDVKRDIRQTMAVSHEMTLEEVAARKWYQKLLGALFNVFSPLM